MDKTLARKKMKAEAFVGMSGNWFTALFLTIANMFFFMVIMSFMGIRVPAVETLNEVMQEGNIAEVIRLFLPEVITKRTIMLYAVVALLYLLVCVPFEFGLTRFYMNVAHRIKGRIRDAFSIFTNIKTIFSSIGMYIIIAVISILWTALFSLVPYAFVFLAMYLKSGIVMYIAMILTAVASVFSVLWTSRYRFAYYILAEGKSGGAISSFRAYRSMMKKNTKEAMTLRATYFLWDMISMTFTPLSFIYKALCGTVYAKYLDYFRGTVSEEKPSEEPSEQA